MAGGPDFSQIAPMFAVLSVFFGGLIGMLPGSLKPSLASRGLQARPNLGLLLPCNVTVREIGGRSEVMAVDLEMMVGIAGENTELIRNPDDQYAGA